MKLHPDILDALKTKTEDVEQLVNDLLFLYVSDEFIRKSDVAGMFVLNKIFRKRVSVGVGVYDEITKEFKGVSVEGKEDTESIFIPDERLHDLLELNTVILVMKTPRTQGIRAEETKVIHITKHSLN
jgi:hypothetical protein